VWLCLEGRSDEREDESGSSELGELEFAEQSRVGAGAIQNRRGTEKGEGERERKEGKEGTGQRQHGGFPLSSYVYSRRSGERNAPRKSGNRRVPSRTDRCGRRTVAAAVRLSLDGLVGLEDSALNGVVERGVFAHKGSEGFVL
jgi:hypothetical protein